MRFVSILALSLMALGASASALPDAFPDVGLEARKSQCAGVAAGSNYDVNGKHKCSKGCGQILVWKKNDWIPTGEECGNDTCHDTNHGPEC